MNIEALLKKIDQSYNVEAIKVNGIPFWPFLKVFFFDKLYVDGGTRVSLTLVQKLKFASSLLYGFFNWFGSAKYLVFSNSDQRKLLDGQWIDKSADYLHPYLKNALHLELPVFEHKNRTQLPYKRVVSHLPLRLLEWLFLKLKNSSLSVEGDSVVDELLDEYGVSINATHLARRFYAQYLTAKLLIRVYRPEKVFMAVPYMKMGYVYAFKEVGITVVEMQHGTINKAHFGYCNYKPFDSNLFPDLLFAYGSQVKEVFEGGNFTYVPSKVMSIGHYYLHLISEKGEQIKETASEVFNARINISVSLQDDSVGSKIVPFLTEVARLRPDWNIVFSPRKTPESAYREMGLPPNILFDASLNVYQIIAASDFHTTVFSTCALEAPVLGVRNMLCNIEGKSSAYFKELLTDQSLTLYANKPSEFVALIEKAKPMSREEIQEAIKPVMNNTFKASLNEAMRSVI